MQTCSGVILGDISGDFVVTHTEDEILQASIVALTAFFRSFFYNLIIDKVTLI